MATATSRSAFLSSATILIFILLFQSTYCWDNDDLEIFDLVEEVNENFYQVLGVEPSSTIPAIKKAFRKLTLKYHPDKNDEEDAEKRFRKFVAIYEVLKDEKKREKYDRVLLEGLPDWRQPVYYFRRARKMSMIELTIVLSVIITFGQYCVFWGIYVERLLALEDMLSSKKKKKPKKNKSSAGVDDDIYEEDTSIPLPSFLNLWPFQLTVFLFYSIYNLPSNIKYWKEERQRMKEEEELQRIEEEEERRREEEERKEMIRKPKKRVQPELPEYSQELYSKFSQPVADGQTAGGLADELQKVSQSLEKFGEEWTDEELVLLAKAVKKFPGGTANRWEKIAEMVGRSVTEVTNKSKESKGGIMAVKVNPSIQGSGPTNKSQVKISDEIITQNLDADNDDIDDDYYSSGKVRKRKKNTKTDTTEKNMVLVSKTNEGMALVDPIKSESKQTNERVSNETVPSNGPSVDGKMNGAEAWNQNQQKILEWALKQYPKGTDRRWDCVAEHIPGKTKEECIARFKILAELISQKKKQELASKTS